MGEGEAREEKIFRYLNGIIFSSTANKMHALGFVIHSRVMLPAGGNQQMYTDSKNVL